ncbi:hypothetical protein [Roseisolibacter sp. H3M3-2]|uniref:hypothetical protein n=1 Tax=Roseisolibacter sp. H3M3-2 TaxID=3031323 RepID=UPI0023DAD3BB|nr:hypothetical protein [Roseisolibacter sp. H3M3-2]MDF1504440.1 hypothetical protein [Roseisolibacter sp. H3M3-2]
MSRFPASAPRLPLTLAALALTAACSDAPLAPDAAPSARPSRAASPAATPTVVAPAGMIPGHIRLLRAGSPNAFVPGATVRFVTDKAILQVRDNGEGDIGIASGPIMAFLPISTSYKAEVVSVPVGYHVPAPTPLYGKVEWSDGAPMVTFPDVELSPKKQVQINLLDMQKRRVPGATVVVTLPGFDFQFVITDGGAGDVNPLGWQLPADGQVTAYMPVQTFASVKVCEQAPPAGFLMANPACQTITNQSSSKSLSVSFLHQGGIVAPPPAS